MTPNRVYMHKDCMDVAFLVSTTTYGTDMLRLTGCWLNLGYVGHPWALGSNTTLFLSNEKAENWVDISDALYLPRAESGVPK